MTDTDVAVHLPDFDNSRGGFWIKPSGEAVPVPGRCKHSEIAREVLGLEGYAASYLAGLIHVTTSADNDSEFGCDFIRDRVTVEALRTLARIVRHHKAARPHKSWTLEQYVEYTYRDDWNSPSMDRTSYRCVDEFPAIREYGPAGADKIARAVIQIALELNAANKAKEASAA